MEIAGGGGRTGRAGRCGGGVSREFGEDCIAAVRNQK